MAYDVVEAGLALWGGIGAQSIALVGFGLDSVIECIAAAALLWRLTVESRGARGDELELAERRVQRIVGSTPPAGAGDGPYRGRPIALRDIQPSK